MASFCLSVNVPSFFPNTCFNLTRAELSFCLRVSFGALFLFVCFGGFVLFLFFDIVCVCSSDGLGATWLNVSFKCSSHIYTATLQPQTHITPRHQTPIVALKGLTTDMEHTGEQRKLVLKIKTDCGIEARFYCGFTSLQLLFLV